MHIYSWLYRQHSRRKQKFYREVSSKMPSLVRKEGSVLAGISFKGQHMESMGKLITFNGQIGELISLKYYVIGQCHLSLICNNRFVWSHNNIISDDLINCHVTLTNWLLYKCNATCWDKILSLLLQSLRVCVDHPAELLDQNCINHWFQC